MSHNFADSPVIDRNYLSIRQCQDPSQSQTTDTTKTADTNSYHTKLLLKINKFSQYIDKILNVTDSKGYC